jgi:PAS domain S-box-containing protein
VVPALLPSAKRVVAGTSRLQRINIGPRLSLCFLLIIVAMLAGNAVLLWQFQQSQIQAERLTGVDQELIAVLQAHTSLMSFYERLDVLAHSEDTALLQTQIETLHHALLEESLRTRTTLSHLPPEVQLDPTLLPTLLAIQGELPAQLETIASLAKSGAWEPVRLRLANQVRPLESRSSALVENVDRVVGEERAQAILNMRQAQRRIFLIVPFTAVITLVFAAFLGWVITRSITHPLGRLVEGSTALAKGDFAHRVPATGHDEIARLGSVFNDMTIRLQEVYRHLQASETYLAEAQKLSQTGSFGWDSASGKIYWSAETFRIFELEPTTKVTVDAILERTHPEDRSTLQEVMERVARDRTTLDVEHRLLMPNGSVKHLRVVGHPFTNDGEFLGAITDITEQKRAQQALAASERNLAAIINTIPTAAWTTRPDGYCDFINQVWLDYAGMTSEKAQGWGWAEAIHPDDRKGLVEYWQSCLASGTPVDTEARIRRFDGAYRWFLFRASALRDESGTIIKWYGTNTDIDDRKRAEAELKRAEEELQQLVEQLRRSEAFLAEGQRLSQAGSFSWCVGTDEITWSEQLYRIFEFDEHLPVTLERIASRVYPDDLPLLQDMIERTRHAASDFEYQHRLLMPDQSVKHIYLIAHATRDKYGRLEYVGAAQDVTRRRLAEEALRSSERNLSLMINAIPTSIHVLRADGSVLYVNQAVLDYTGLTLEDVKKESYRSRVFHPEDVERLRDERRVALTRPIPFETEQRVLGKDGGYRWFLVRYNPLLDEQGRIDRWYVAAFDIEDRKRAESELKQAYLHFSEAQRLSKTGSFITDLLLDEHIWSEELRRICEFDPKATVTVQMVRDIIHPEDVSLYEAAVARGMAGKDVDFLFRIVTSRGVVKHLRGIARVTELIAGRPLFSGAIQDVTEIKLAEEALNRARSELAHVARVTTLNALTASIAHEVNQPLSGIITNASTCLRMLNADPPNADGARETARRIIRDGNRASDVISRLRALFSKKEFTLEPLDFNEAAREVMALSLSDLQRNRVILRSELAENLPPVTGDRIQLQQVILNLLRNASDAMNTVEDRPRELLVKTDRDEEDRVRLSVKDVGVGFRPEAVDKLFEAFYTTKKDGMGIGLSVSRSIIEAHQGHLWAVPNEGPGTTFSFSIPCRSALGADFRTAVKPMDSAADAD